MADHVVIALAGRRIDPPDAVKERFPRRSIEPVSMALKRLFTECQAAELVSSAASGADLLAVLAAEAMGLEQTIILPFAQKRFRELSVADRPGQWTGWFDSACERASLRGRLIELENDDSDPAQAFMLANRCILDRAQALVQGGRAPLAVIVWEGVSHGEHDATLDLFRAAIARGWSVRSVATM